jgi:hypothetical protein
MCLRAQGAHRQSQGGRAEKRDEAGWHGRQEHTPERGDPDEMLAARRVGASARVAIFHGCWKKRVRLLRRTPVFSRKRGSEAEADADHHGIGIAAVLKEAAILDLADRVFAEGVLIACAKVE